jgi:hypothetical protein
LSKGGSRGQRHDQAAPEFVVAALDVLGFAFRVECRIVRAGRREEAHVGQHGLDQLGILPGVAAGGAQLVQRGLDLALHDRVGEGHHVGILAQAIENQRAVGGVGLGRRDGRPEADRRQRLGYRTGRQRTAGDSARGDAGEQAPHSPLLPLPPEGAMPMAW